MTLFHFFSCAALTFGPHVIFYTATPLSEYDTFGTCLKAAVVYLGTTLIKLVCLATFLQVSENDRFDLYQVLTVSLAALGSLMWLRKNKPKAVVPIIYASAGVLATMPSITSYLQRGLDWDSYNVIGFELLASFGMALITWHLYSICQRPAV
eukprot:c19339_g2_i2 orf=598-1053(-)